MRLYFKRLPQALEHYIIIYGSRVQSSHRFGWSWLGSFHPPPPNNTLRRSLAWQPAAESVAISDPVLWIPFFYNGVKF